MRTKNESQITTAITLLTRTDGKPAGKTFDELGKHVAEHFGAYHANTVTLSAPTAVELLERYSDLVSHLTIEQALILGHAPNLPTEYEIRPAKSLRDPNGINWVNGKPTIARLKPHFTPARILLLDFDPDPRMPEAWRALGEQDRWDLLADALPEFSGAARWTIPSGSGRVLDAAGRHVSPGPLGSHTYIVTTTDLSTNDMDAARVALEVRLWAAGLGYMVESKAGAALKRTLFDSVVWVTGREVFDGPPCVKPPFQLAPLTSSIHAGSAVEIVTSIAVNERLAFEQTTGARIIENTSAPSSAGLPPKKKKATNDPIPVSIRPRISIENHDLLRIDTTVVTEKGPMTIRAFLDAGYDRLRCQATFRESTSWAGILRRARHGAFLYDVGTGTTYRMGSEPNALTGDLLLDLKKLGREHAANAQGTARAILWRHHWRCPTQVPWKKLITSICTAHPAVDERDINDLGVYLAQKAYQTAIASVILNGQELPRSVIVHYAQDIDAVRVGINAIGGGVHLCKATHGAGKTEHLLKPIALQRNGVIAIAPRVSLVSDLATRCNLAHYQMTDSDPDLALCINSLINPKYSTSINQARAVLIDEIARITRDCHDQHSTLKKEANNVWNQLTCLMQTADIAVGVDADLATSDVRMLAGSIPVPIHLWIVHDTPTDLRGTFQSVEVVLKKIDEALAAGIPSMITADSAKLIAGLADELRGRYPHLRILDIHNFEALATKGTPEALGFLKDINANAGQWDVVLFSPTVESGVSLSVAHFQRHFAFYYGTVEPNAFNQMLRRDRTARHWDIAIQGTGMNSRPDTYLEVLNGLQAAQRRLVELDNGTFSIEPATPYDLDCCRVIAASNAARNSYARNLWYLLKHRGWKIERGSFDKDENGKKLRNAAALAVDIAKNFAICKAEDLPKEELEKLSEAYSLTPEQAAAVARAQVRETTGTPQGELDSKHVDVWQDGKLDSQNRLFAALTATAQPSDRDRKEAEAKLPIALRSFDAARTEAVQTLFKVLGLDPETGQGMVTEKSALQAYNTLKDTDQGRALSHFGIARLDRVPTYPVRWVNDVLGKLGLYLDCVARRGAGGRKGRTYAIGHKVKVNQDGRLVLPGWNLMCAIRARRLSATSV
ncbi:hypothetical protein HW932_20170 [Allochromatium humboldtianum]|uniref:Uncharacterized protein n=1 Tax=Allochromatium humboldtianum TaxID=504901 RepID=A0A850RDZ1_9GAMM|nr:plasmid replication protein, CyRepA1 family [Allochromatium humboldtianum]NVZ11568.1 hypothetical protein [Allochromatium humboldtianum]